MNPPAMPTVNATRAAGIPGMRVMQTGPQHMAGSPPGYLLSASQIRVRYATRHATKPTTGGHLDHSYWSAVARAVIAPAITMAVRPREIHSAASRWRARREFGC